MESGTSRSLGEGWLAGVGSDGSFLYVTDLDPSSDALGCEGMPVEYLWTVDIATGDRRPVMGDGARLSSARVENSLSGRVVVVGVCEEMVNTITVYDEETSGELTGGRIVDSVPMGIVPLVAWAGDDLLIGAEHPEEVYTGAIDLFVVDGETLTSETLFTMPVGGPLKAALVGGDLIVWVDRGLVRVQHRDGSGVIDYPGSDFAVSADESSIAVVNGTELSVGPLREGLSPVIVGPDESWFGYPTWSSDSRTVAVLHQPNSGLSEVVIARLPDNLIRAGSHVRPGFRFAGESLAYGSCSLDGCGVQVVDVPD